MKKVISILITLVMLVACAAMASATDKADVLSALKDAMPQNYFDVQYTAIENMLNQVEVTSEQADQLIALINETKAGVQDKGENLTMYTKAEKDLVIANLQKAADILGLTMTIEAKTGDKYYEGDSIAVFTNAEGKKIGTLDGTSSVKKTDVVETSVAPFVAVAMLALAAVSFLGVKKVYSK